MMTILIAVYILIVSFMEPGYICNMFFVYGAVALWCASLLFSPARKFISVEIGLLLSWALMCIFLHTDTVGQKTIIFRYLNIYLMSEGFIYLFCGAIFLKLFVEHVKDIKPFYFILPLCFIPWLTQNSVSPMLWANPGNIMVQPWSIANSRFTILFSFVISTIIYLFIKKKNKTGIVLCSLMSLIAVLKWQAICLKFACRPVIWIDMFHKIKEHPFVGTGFNKTLISPDMMWVDYQSYGYVLKHNDYGALAMNLGIIPVIILGVFLVRIYLKIYKQKIAIPFLAFCICSFFQSTVYSVYHDVVISSIVGMALIKKG